MMTAKPSLPTLVPGPNFRVPWRVMLPIIYPLGVIPLSDIAQDFLGMSERQAKERAASGTLDLPAFRLGSQKSQWVVKVEDFCDLVDARAAQARARWEVVTGGQEAA
jgi:hypothetical protein